MKKIIKKNKKGQIFTLIAIALILLLFLSVDVYSYIRQKEVIKDRIKTMDSFMTSLENNLERQVYISGFRIIFLGISETASTGNYLTNFDSFVNEAFFNGTVNGVIAPLMIEATRDELVESVNQKARKINANVSMEDTQINITQEDPWTIKVLISSDFVLEDLQGLAEWRKKQNITAYISIEGFQDPLYIVNTYGTFGAPRFNTTIKKTPYEGYYVVSGNYANLSDHYDKGYYAANPLAPSFLNRLKGNLNPDENGIESFAHVTDLNAHSSSTTYEIDDFDPLFDKTHIDYLYLDRTDNTQGDMIIGVSCTSFCPKIDDGHKCKYNITPC